MQGNISLRSIIIAAILIPINCYWIIQNEAVKANIYSTTSSLLFNVIFTLFLLKIFNLLLKSLKAKWALKPFELLTIYTLLCLASAAAGEGTSQLLVPLLGHASWNATVENEWSELFSRYLPNSLVIADKAVLSDYYEGGSTLYLGQHLKAWLPRITIWVGFFSIILFVMLCLNVLLMRRWIGEERLSYPIIQLPLQMSSETEGDFLKNRLMWLGFGGAGGLGLLNGLHFLNPLFPGFKNIYNLQGLFSDKPWDAITIEGIFLAFYPCAVGLGFFVPLSLAFSCWFFYFFWKGELVLGSLLGLKQLPGFPYAKDQESGAYIGIGVLALWTIIRQLRSLSASSSGKMAENKSNKLPIMPIGQKAALWGTVVGLLALVGFCLGYGMSPAISALFF